MRAEAGGPGYVVIGIGINVALDETARTQISAAGTEPCDLRSLGVPPLQRNAVAASLIECLIRGLTVFEHEGLQPFREEWQRADALRGQGGERHHGAGARPAAWRAASIWTGRCWWRPPMDWSALSREKSA